PPSSCLSRQHLHTSPTRRSSDLDRDDKRSKQNSPDTAERLIDVKGGAQASKHQRECRTYLLSCVCNASAGERGIGGEIEDYEDRDRKSTRLNSSHQIISYAVFCL